MTKYQSRMGAIALGAAFALSLGAAQAQTDTKATTTTTTYPDGSQAAQSKEVQHSVSSGNGQLTEKTDTYRSSTYIPPAPPPPPPPVTRTETTTVTTGGQP